MSERSNKAHAVDAPIASLFHIVHHRRRAADVRPKNECRPMRRWSAITIIAAVLAAALAEASPLSFTPFVWPTTVNRDAYVVFSMVATNDGSTGISYELISAPPGVGFGTYLEVDHYYTMKWEAFFSWNTPSLAGSTNLFVVRAYDVTDPSIAATGSVSMVVIDVPPISSIQVTNDSAMLQLPSLLTDRSYDVEWSASIPATNWSTLCHFFRGGKPPVVFDTGPLQERRFYRLSGSYDYYAMTVP